MGLGIYIHIPFCSKKCPYCDFYSVNYADTLAGDYTAALISAIKSYSGKRLGVDTVYFGGGTPNLLGEKSIAAVLEALCKSFKLSEDCEITMEANPESLSVQGVLGFKNAGINRLSMGLQSANLGELRSLGRTHTPQQVLECVDLAHKAGIDNISLDLMLGIQGQNKESLKSSIEFCDSAGTSHISAYLLKIEPNTPFHKKKALLNLPDDDMSAELYEFACNELAKKGYEQYEISNFAKSSLYSRHNTKYWQCEEYLGFGAAAHGFFEGRRYFYERKIENFIKEPLKTIDDGKGGSAEEVLMLALRLSKGIDAQEFSSRFSLSLKPQFFGLIDSYVKAGLMIRDKSTISITQKGFLVSNSIISRLISLL